MAVHTLVTPVASDIFAGPDFAQTEHLAQGVS